jgi:uracil permease
VVALITFIAAGFIAIKGKGFFKVIPFLCAMLIGYGFASLFGLVDFSIFQTVGFIEIPRFSMLGTYTLDFSAILMFAPIALVTMAEHIGDHSVLGEIMDENLIESPGLGRTLLGDGLATLVAGGIGGPANTSYGENIGVVSITGVKTAWVTGIAAVFAIMISFMGYMRAFIYSIP